MIGRQQAGYWIAKARLKCLPAAEPQAILAGCARLSATSGVHKAECIDDEIIVEYDFRECSHRQVMAVLSSPNVLRPPGVRERFSHFVIQYREDVRRSEQSMEYGWEGWIREVYVSRYKHRDHGRRDDRLKHWRQYMNDDEAN